MLPKAMSHPPAPNFHATHWQHREAWQTTWHALETSFGRGESFVHALLAWQDDANAPHTLFFSAFSADTPSNLHPLIAAPCFGLLPGVHRIGLQDGRVQLTLYIGLVPAIARELDMAADSIGIEPLAAWDARAIARLCKRGTALHWTHAHAQDLEALQQAGVQLNTKRSEGVYQPQWEPKSSLRPSLRPTSRASPASSPQHALVIGAGLSGAAVAHSLAIRGWTVDVLDQGEQLGAGASGLPAGIFATHVSPDNNVLSRITRDGVRATVHRAQQLLEQGIHWQVSQLLEHRFAGKRQLPAASLWPAAGHEWSTAAQDAQKLAGGLSPGAAALWHPLAGWIQTPAFVKAQLAHPHITWRGACQVAKLRRLNSEWLVLDKQGNRLGQSKHVVLANAHQCQALLDTVDYASDADHTARPHLPATALRGQVTWGTMAMLPHSLSSRLPAFPVNGHGSYIGKLKPLDGSPTAAFWLVGSSFQRNDFDVTTRPEDQQSNLQQWAELMPALRDEILTGIDPLQTHAWASIRSALPDRVPAVGAFQHPAFKGLQVCTGMGARGLSWSVLCGELLAAQLNHEPLPMAASLAKLMAASRFG
jgi:tRNA 5-methylaminomethyl-2-thiouridine biosynthesis bifunctional protein